ncbi:MAG: thioredoxin [Silvanigrellales bacterium]|nr:thioredoxin [Silvanigrellales bacterium]
MSDLVLNVTEKNFKTEVLESNIPVILDFWAEWCGPCLALGPTLEEVAKERSGKVRICKVNVEEEPNLAAQFNIRNIPFLAFIKNGQKVGELVGNQAKATILKAVDAVSSTPGA